MEAASAASRQVGPPQPALARLQAGTTRPASPPPRPRSPAGTGCPPAAPAPGPGGRGCSPGAPPPPPPSPSSAAPAQGGQGRGGSRDAGDTPAHRADEVQAAAMHGGTQVQPATHPQPRHIPGQDAAGGGALGQRRRPHVRRPSGPCRRRWCLGLGRRPLGAGLLVRLAACCPWCCRAAALGCCLWWGRSLALACPAGDGGGSDVHVQALLCRLPPAPPRECRPLTWLRLWCC